VYWAGKQSTGVITYDNISDDDVYIKGEFLEFILQDRVFETSRSYDGKVEDVCRSIVSDFFVSPQDPARIMPALRLGQTKELGGDITLPANREDSV